MEYPYSGIDVLVLLIFNMPAIRPFTRLLRNTEVSAKYTIFTRLLALIESNKTLLVSQSLASASLYTGTPPRPPTKPKTNIKMKGNTKLKTTAEGLLNIDLRVALVMANIAFTWLYDDIQLSLKR